jgi:plastocyanin
MHVRGPRVVLTTVVTCTVLAFFAARPMAQPERPHGARANAVSTPASPRAGGVEPHAVVRGKVEIGVPVHTRRQAGAYATRALPVTPLAPPSEVRNVVVYLKDAPARPSAPIHADIQQENETFVPHVIAVPVGSTVDFPNDDPFYHNVFSLSKAKSFNLGRYPKGESRQVKFDKAGVVKVFCDIHSHMSATVIVFNHPWYAIPDENGRFELDDVPPGNHQITAWHERLGDTTMAVRVEAGRPVTADFTLPVPPK